MVGIVDEVIMWLFKQDRNKKYEVKEYKEKRSLDANAYFHVLVGELAKAMSIPADEMKIQMNLDYGTIARNEDGSIVGYKIPAGTKPIYEYSKWYKTDTDGCDCYICYKATHELNTKEMSDLINGVVQECKQLGIETRPEHEIKSLLENWK